jgi:hypothetical protein
MNHYVNAMITGTTNNAGLIPSISELGCNPLFKFGRTQRPKFS